MKTFQSLHPRLYPIVKDCPLAYIIQAVRDTVIEFCTETLIWQHTLPGINLTTSNKTYAVTSNVSQTMIHRVLEVTADNQRLRPQTQYNWSSGKDAIVLESNPPRNATAGLVVKVALKPTQEATEFHNDRLWDDYSGFFVSGTAARLLVQKATPWTDLTMAAQYRLEFNKGIGAARHEVRRDRQFILNTATATHKFI